MGVTERSERSFSGVVWHVVEERRQFDVLKRRFPARPDHASLRALHVHGDKGYRLRTKGAGRTRFVLAEAATLKEIAAYAAAFERALEGTDTAHWDGSRWDAVAGAVERQLGGQGLRRDSYTLIAEASAPQIRVLREDAGDAVGLSAQPVPSPRSSASDGSAGSSGLPLGSALFLGRALWVLGGRLGAAQRAVGSHPMLTAGGVGVVVVAWYLGVALGAFFIVALWLLSDVADQAPRVADEHATLALRRAIARADHHAEVGLRLLAWPGLVRGVVFPCLCVLLWAYPASFQLALLCAPLAIPALRAFQPPTTPRPLGDEWTAVPPPRTPKPPQRPAVSIPPLQFPAVDAPANNARSGSLGGSLTPRTPDAGVPRTPRCPTMVGRLLDLHLSSGWEPLKAVGDMAVESKLVPGCDNKAFRLTTVFESSLEAVGTWLSTTDNVYKTDALIDQRTIVERVDEHTMITLSTYRSPMFGVSRRDAVLEMTRLYLSPEEAQALGLRPCRTFVEASGSVEHPACPRTTGYVRSKVHCAGYIAQEEGPRRVALINVGLASPEGWIPGKVVDAVGVKLIGKIQKLRELVEASNAGAAP